jgi:DNA-binding XRE family transcriptional regulator
MLGRRLKQLREKAGVSQAAACRAIEVAPQTLWRIETGQPGPKLKDIYVDTLCRLYGAPEGETPELIGLVGETKNNGWWYAYSDVVPTDFDLYLGLEECARKMTSLHLTLLPGLLQTASYRRAVIWAAFPGMPTAEVERRVQIQTNRQSRLMEPPEQFSVNMFLGEAALRYPVGGRSVIQEQRYHILEASRLPCVTLRVVPMSIEMAAPLMTGSFTLLEFPPHPTSRLSEPPVVYIEGYTGALYLDKPGEIERYKLAGSAIHSVALNEEDTRQLIVEIAREYE